MTDLQDIPINRVAKKKFSRGGVGKAICYRRKAKEYKPNLEEAWRPCRHDKTLSCPDCAVLRAYKQGRKDAMEAFSK